MPLARPLAGLVLSSLALASAGAAPAPVESSVDRAIAQANAMVKLGMPPSEVEQWLLSQVKSHDTDDAGTTVTVQTPPPSWDVYATAAWAAQEKVTTRSAESQGEDVFTRTRLGGRLPDQDFPHGPYQQAADVHQRGPQAADAVYAPGTAQRTDDVRGGTGGPARQ